jgi:hypothetical protein
MFTTEHQCLPQQGRVPETNFFGYLALANGVRTLVLWRSCASPSTVHTIVNICGIKNMNIHTFRCIDIDVSIYSISPFTHAIMC